MALKNYEINRISWGLVALTWICYSTTFIDLTSPLIIMVGTIGIACSIIGTLGFAHLLIKRRIKPLWMCADRTCRAHRDFINGIPEDMRLNVFPQRNKPVWKCPKCRDKLVPYDTCRKIGFQ